MLCRHPGYTNLIQLKNLPKKLLQWVIKFNKELQQNFQVVDKIWKTLKGFFLAEFLITGNWHVEKYRLLIFIRIDLPIKKLMCFIGSKNCHFLVCIAQILYQSHLNLHMKSYWILRNASNTEQTVISSNSDLHMSS